jgi:hypothetical protein
MFLDLTGTFFYGTWLRKSHSFSSKLNPTAKEAQYNNQ